MPERKRPRLGSGGGSLGVPTRRPRGPMTSSRWAAP